MTLGQRLARARHGFRPLAGAATLPAQRTTGRPRLPSGDDSAAPPWRPLSAPQVNDIQRHARPAHDGALPTKCG